jgi:prophage DNA circulation protein
MKNTFLDNLRPASWKGVPFQVKGDDSEFGRNIAVHEFVQRDRPYIEDLGRKTRKLTLDAWIAASKDNNFDPWPQRDALITAVESGGKGTLVHPFYGTLQGSLFNLKVKQASTESGGMIVLSMEFIESGELEFRATLIQDTQGRVSSSVERVYAAVQPEFATAFSTDGVQGFVVDDAVASMKQFRDALYAVRRGQNLVSQVANGNLGAIEVFAKPLELARDIVDVTRDVTDPQALHSFDRPTITRTNTAGRIQQAANQNAFVHLIRIASLARAAELASDLKAQSNRYSADSVYLRDTPALLTRNEMEALRRQIASSIMDELMLLSSLQIYPESQQALLQLRTDAIQHMTAEGETLARTFTTNCCDGTDWNSYMPTLVLAYGWYGVLSDDVINERNHIPNPLFIPPAAKVELLHAVN